MLLLYRIVLVYFLLNSIVLSHNGLFSHYDTDFFFLNQLNIHAKVGGCLKNSMNRARAFFFFKLFTIYQSISSL